MAKFHVKSTFELPDAQLFVMAGSIVEGEVRAGMVAHVPFNSAVSMTDRIHSIEFARRSGGEDVCLCFKCEKGALELWRAMNIGDEILEISEDLKT